MLLAGEAIGKWQSEQPVHDEQVIDGCKQLPNQLELPFRRQPAPGKNISVERIVHILSSTHTSFF